jgi:hypothetical protein
MLLENRSAPIQLSFIRAADITGEQGKLALRVYD